MLVAWQVCKVMCVCQVKEVEGHLVRTVEHGRTRGLLNDT